MIKYHSEKGRHYVRGELMRKLVEYTLRVKWL